MPVWKELIHDTEKVSPGSVVNATNDRIENLDLQYDEQAKTLTFTGTIRSSTRPVGYSLILTFKNVDRTQGLTEEEILQGYQPKPSLANNEVAMRCSCPSYRFRFAEANKHYQAATGPGFGVYHRKTDRAPNNPQNLPGACKHLISFIIYLQDRDFIH